MTPNWWWAWVTCIWNVKPSTFQMIPFRGTSHMNRFRTSSIESIPGSWPCGRRPNSKCAMLPHDGSVGKSSTPSCWSGNMAYFAPFAKELDWIQYGPEVKVTWLEVSLSCMTSLLLSNHFWWWWWWWSVNHSPRRQRCKTSLSLTC